MVRRAERFSAALVAVIALCSGCSDASGPTGLARNDLPALIVSPIMHGGASVRTTSRITASTTAHASFSAAASGMNAYVSLPPGSVPGGISAAIRDGTAGTALAVTMVDGGFDPVAIAANVGDTLFVAVTRAGTAGTVNGFERVVAYGAPSVVRTSPARGTKDVALNETIVVVFSAPLDPSTVDTGSIRLWRGTSPVPGTVRFADTLHLRVEFHPDSLLGSQTDYQLVVTQAVHDANGVALDSAISVPFTTGTTGTTSAASLAGFVIDAAEHCINGARLELIDGPRAGAVIVQEGECDFWGYGDGGYSFNDLPLGVPATIRATASGYQSAEVRAVPTNPYSYTTMIVLTKEQ
jgi:hypothetical protein